MTQKIESWQGFENILTHCGALSRHFGNLAKSMTGEEKVALADKLVRVCVGHHDDEQAVVMLELMERAQKERFMQEALSARKAFDEYLEELFWTLPSSCEHHHRDSNGTLVETKQYIFGQLIKQWRATELPETVYAFRRLIAMGWPERKDYRQRNGESDVEMKARGRHVSDTEREGLVAIVRNHMEGFASYDEKKAGPNAVFGPWLAHACVPDEVRHTLAVARARAGGANMAMLDMRNADILKGIPDSGLEFVRQAAERMREVVVAGSRVAPLTAEAFKKSLHARDHYYVERYFRDAERTTHFVDADTIEFKFGPYGKAEDLFVAAVEAITQVRDDSILKTFSVQLTVVGNPQGDEVHKTIPTLTKSWQREK